MNKQRRKKELRNIYEYIKGEQYVKQLQKEPSVSWFEYVELKSKKIESYWFSMLSYNRLSVNNMSIKSGD